MITVSEGGNDMQHQAPIADKPTVDEINTKIGNKMVTGGGRHSI